VLGPAFLRVFDIAAARADWCWHIDKYPRGMRREFRDRKNFSEEEILRIVDRRRLTWQVNLEQDMSSD
jgi:hypothetical protein